MPGLLGISCAKISSRRKLSKLCRRQESKDEKERRKARCEVNAAAKKQPRNLDLSLESGVRVN